MFKQSTRWVMWAGVATLALLTAACGVAQAQGSTVTPTSNGSQPTSDIGVVGTGRVFADPDTALASVGVEITAPTLAQATADANTRMTAVLAKIKSLGVEAKDITTISYSVNPQTAPPKEGETPRIVGYHVSNVVQLKIRKKDDVGKILDTAIAAGANTLSGVYFTIDDPSALQAQARTKAVKDAMAKAKTLADAAGVRLGKIISITEGVSVRPITEKVFAAPAARMDAGGPGPIETGQAEISVSVEMHWQIEQ